MIWSLLFSGEKQASKAWPTAIVLATIGYILYDYLIEPLFHGSEKEHRSEKEHSSGHGEVKRVGRIVLREGAPYVFFTVLLHIYLSSIAEDWKLALDWLALFVASGALTLGWLNGIRSRPTTAARQGASTTYVATLWISTFLTPILTLYATFESGGLDIKNVFSFFGFYYVGFVYLTTLYAYLGGMLIDRTQSLPRAWQFSIGVAAVIILQLIAVLATLHWNTEVGAWKNLLLRPVLMGIGWCVALLPCLEFRKSVTLPPNGQLAPGVIPESIGSTAEKITRSLSSWVVINIGALFFLAGILWVIWATYNNWMADVLVVLGALILATGQVMGTGGSVDRAGVITVAVAVTMLLASWATLWWGHNHDAQFESKYHYMRGLDQDKNGEWEAAIREYTAAQRKDPESVEIQKRLAWTYLNHGDPKNAETESRAILSRDPNNLGEVHCILAIALLHLHKVDWSVAESRHTISNSNPACAHYALGEALLVQNNPAQAIAEFTSAKGLRLDFEIKSEVAVAHNELGEQLEQKGEWDKAIKEFRDAVTNDPSLSVAQQNLEGAMDKQKFAMMPEPAEPSRFLSKTAEFQNVWATHNVWQGGDKGMMIHINLSTSNLQSDQLNVAVFFRFQGTDKRVKAALEKFKASGSADAVVFRDIISSVSQGPTELELFLPYRALSLPAGTSYLEYHAVIRTKEDWKVYADSGWQAFRYTQQAPSTGKNQGCCCTVGESSRACFLRCNASALPCE